MSTRRVVGATKSSIKWELQDSSNITASIWKRWQRIMAQSTESKIKLILPVPPPLNHRAKLSNGRFYLVQNELAFKKEVAYILKKKKVMPFMGPVSVTIVWYRKIKSGDIDGRIKSLLDSLNGLAYLDDDQVSLLMILRNDSDPKNSRMEVEIEDLSLDVFGESD